MQDLSADYLEPYVRSQERHGSGFDVTLWASPMTQRRRFEVMAAMVELEGKRVLDAGCSRGDFAQWLLEVGIRFREYVGIDALPEVIDFANDQKLARCRFMQADILKHPGIMAEHKPEVICISGTLNTMSFRTALQFLDAAWRAAGETLIFNFLSDRHGPEAPVQTHPARRFNTLKLLDWAFRRTPEVAFRQDYLPDGHDATILMHR
ncbi:MAG: methyltransferase domain-containing protein [Phycisphaeraceae bacterium]|nr:methyltransferase domain-containing protein [Phycisphaeraceae bacterium]